MQGGPKRKRPGCAKAGSTGYLDKAMDVRFGGIIDVNHMMGIADAKVDTKKGGERDNSFWPVLVRRRSASAAAGIAARSPRQPGHGYFDCPDWQPWGSDVNAGAYSQRMASLHRGTGQLAAADLLPAPRARGWREGPTLYPDRTWTRLSLRLPSGEPATDAANRKVAAPTS